MKPKKYLQPINKRAFALRTNRGRMIKNNITIRGVKVIITIGKEANAIKIEGTISTIGEMIEASITETISKSARRRSSNSTLSQTSGNSISTIISSTKLSS